MVGVLKDAVRNPCLVAPLAAWVLSQLLKFLLTALKTGNFITERLIGSGGMPSAHGATVCALTVSIGITAGVSSLDFALSAIFALVVMYDARGIRLEAGRHARALNTLSDDRKENGKEALHDEGKPYRELVGHTLPQVLLGALLGIIVAVIVCRIMP